MRRSLARFSGPGASNRSPSSADSITSTPGFEFLVHTGVLHVPRVRIGGAALFERALLGVGFGRSANHCNDNCVNISTYVKPYRELSRHLMSGNALEDASLVHTNYQPHARAFYGPSGMEARHRDLIRTYLS